MQSTKSSKMQLLPFLLVIASIITVYAEANDVEAVDAEAVEADSDFCASKPCSLNAHCKTSYCACKDGYTGDGYTCTNSRGLTSCKNQFGRKGATFKVVGCGNQYLKPLSSMVMLKNFRDSMKWPFTDDTSMNWNKIKCQCAELAKKKGKKYFSLRFWGECMASNSFGIVDFLTKKVKKSLKSNQCYSTRTYDLCSRENTSKALCVGGAGADYIFEISGVGPPGFG